MADTRSADPTARPTDMEDRGHRLGRRSSSVGPEARRRVQEMMRGLDLDDVEEE
jgi:hypothetical protein